MIDLVSADLGETSGIERAVAVSSLKNFRQPKNAAEAKSDCRMKNALLYSPSYEFEEGVFKELALRNGAAVFSFSDILHEQGFRRGIALSKMRLALSSCRKAGCSAVVCTLANNENEARNSRELSSFMAVLGMSGEERKHAAEELERLVRE